jgi:general secretion pathway protein G
MRSQGFTYVEMLFAVAILGLLATVAVPYADISVKRNKEVELNRSLREIRTAIDNYKKAVDEKRIAKKADQSPYPLNLLELVNGVEDATSAENKKLFFLRRIPRDPMNTDKQLLPEQTWGLRSSSSPPNDPQPGADVFDIYSLSKQQGLNGVPYNKW